jgi:hypothetical protein
MFRQLLQRTFAILVAVGLAATSAAGAAETSRHQRVGDVDIYYGILPAQVAGRHDPTHEERAMHGGVPPARDEYHLIVALYHKDGTRITDAQVSATVAELGMTGTRKKLDLMHIQDAPSFGNYFALRGTGPYRITLDVRVGGAARPIEANFEYRLR